MQQYEPTSNFKYSVLATMTQTNKPKESLQKEERYFTDNTNKKFN